MEVEVSRVCSEAEEERRMEERGEMDGEVEDVGRETKSRTRCSSLFRRGKVSSGRERLAGLVRKEC